LPFIQAYSRRGILFVDCDVILCLFIRKLEWSHCILHVTLIKGDSTLGKTFNAKTMTRKYLKCKVMAKRILLYFSDII